GRLATNGASDAQMVLSSLMNHGPLPSADFSRVFVFVAWTLFVMSHWNGGGSFGFSAGFVSGFPSFISGGATTALSAATGAAAGGGSSGGRGSADVAGSVFTGFGAAGRAESAGSKTATRGGAKAVLMIGTTGGFSADRTAASGSVRATATPATTMTAQGVAARRLSEGLSTARRRCSRCEGCAIVRMG